MPRFYLDQPLTAGADLALPSGAARHAQVLRLQPGSELVLFNGRGGEWPAVITRMGRSEVWVRVGQWRDREREAARAITLCPSLMAAERMDWLVEKASELGAVAVQPVLSERSSLRLSSERAEKKRAHWQAVAAAACEQCGRNRVPAVPTPMALPALLQSPVSGARWLLSLDEQAPRLPAAMAQLAPGQTLSLLSGPEGGFSPAEEAAARAAGWQAVHLGPRVLRAETAPLAALAVLMALE